MSEKIVLIDGHSILNRAFYGVPDLTNAEGMHTGAVYGFLNILFSILDQEQPDYLAVAFDVHQPTFRHEMYAAYKGTRKPMPPELREQVPLMKEVLRAMHIQTVEQPGLEADDILGTLARRAEKDGMEVSLVSGDRDLLQIATNRVKIRIPKTKGGRTQIEDYYAADVEAAYQVNPTQFIELKALMGDTADNIPGVPKVGEKTAKDLMVTYGSIENIYAHLEEISKKSIRESLRENRELADLSKTLATIKTDADFEFTFENARVGSFFQEDSYPIFKKLGFKNFLTRFDSQVKEEKADRTLRVIEDLNEAEAYFSALQQSKGNGLITAAIVPVMEAEKMASGAVSQIWNFYGIAVAGEGTEAVFLPTQGFLTWEYLAQKVSQLEHTGRLGVCEAKKLYRFLRDRDSRHAKAFDVQIAAYLCNPLKNDYTMEDITAEYLGKTLPDLSDYGKKSLAECMQEEESAAYLQEYYGRYVTALYESTVLLQEKLQNQDMLELFETMEMPLSYVLFDMEREGVEVCPEQLQNYGQALVSRIEELEQAIWKQAGEEFNIHSPKQLGEILFEKMKLPGAKKTKSGYSTAADILDKLAEDYPIVQDILEYRGLTKLKSTYADGLMNFVGEDKRIHTNFNQTITATGRISSTEPNLQNIPMRTELGRKIREVFVAKDGCVFMDADYSQIELRILAHMSKDQKLIEAYESHEDIHAITASQVFGVPFNEVTPLQRRNAKAVNFGIVYGISAFGLSRDLSISKKEAAQYIDQYFATYPGVKTYLDACVELAKKEGFSETLYKRRRPIPELASSNFMTRSFGERVAMNAPIQGTAADIIKIAMIKVYEGLNEAGLKTRLILQIHDELLLEVPEEEVEQARQILQTAMESAADLAVKLEIDLHTGKNWYDAK